MALEKSLVSDLINTARACRTVRAELLAKHGLYSGQDVLLNCLLETDGQTMGSLAQALGVRPPTITKMVSRMAAQNLLERKQSPIDTRQTYVYLTDDGRKLSKKIEKIWKQADKLALSSLKPKQVKQLSKILNMVAADVATGSSKGDIS